MSLSPQKWTLYLALVCFGGTAGWFGNNYWRAPQNRVQSPTRPVVVGQDNPLPPSTPPRLQPHAGISNFITQAVGRVGPAVVRIDATRVDHQLSDNFKNPILKRFFGKEEGDEGEEKVRHGTGAGVIISPEGRLITNAHVVTGVDRVKVTLNDGRIFDGRVLGVDTLTDVAVVKVEGQQLPIAPLGNSEEIIPGQWAIAIGNPLGLDNTVTIGIISAIGRSSSQVGIADKRVRFIQTDAAINPGNSGGPLLNELGEVIGINTAIRADAQGLGFAIPIETAKRIADQLFNNGRADHPFLGIQMEEINAINKKSIVEKYQLNFSLDQGVLIVQVVENAPASKAGIMPGDILESINGFRMKTPGEVQEKVESSSLEEDLTLEINRQGKIQVIKVKPIAFPTSPEKEEG
jgi:S1-C subfamily serine protease